VGRLVDGHGDTNLSGKLQPVRIQRGNEHRYRIDFKEKCLLVLVAHWSGTLLSDAIWLIQRWITGLRP
jgi:hypothetical protein